MEITTKQRDAKSIEIILKGELDTVAAGKFANEMQSVLSAEYSIIDIDFTELEYISSAGMRTILLLNKTATAKGGKLSIKGMSEDIKQIFQMTGFDQMIEII